MKELTWNERGRLWLRLLVRAILLLSLGLLVYKIGLPALSYCMPFVVGLACAWLMERLVKYLTKRSIFSRKSVTVALILSICGILGGALFWLGYQIVQQINGITNDWDLIWGEISTAMDKFAALNDQILGYLPLEVEHFVRDLGTQLMEGLKELGTTEIIPKTTSFAIQIPSVVLAALFFFMSLYFLMADFPRLGSVATGWLPANFRAFLRYVVSTVRWAFSGYIRAETLLSLVVFVILYVGFRFMGIPYALLLSVLFAIMDFIPIIGSGTVMVPWALVALLLGDWPMAVQLMVIWGIVVVFRRVAEPRFLGSQTGLHPFLGLLSIYVGMRAFGVLGMVLAPTVFLVVIRVCSSGVFSPVVDDVTMAFEDISAFLQNRGKTEKTTVDD